MDLNRVTLTGTLERDPITRLQDTGTPQVRCTLFVPCAADSSAAAHAGEPDPGDTDFGNPVSEIHLSGSRFSGIFQGTTRGRPRQREGQEQRTWQ